MKLLGVFVITFQCFFYVASAQDLMQCKKTLKQSFSKMSAIYADTSPIHLHYKVSAMYAADKSVSADDINLYMGSGLYIMTSSAVSYFADQKNAFMVIGSQKKIYQIDLLEIEKTRIQQVNQFSEKLIDSSAITGCTTLENENLKITLTYTGSNALLKSNVTNVEYLIDGNNGHVKECILHYTKSNPLAYTSYKFVEVKQYASIPYSAPIKSLFFNNKNVLLSNYSDYKYQDLRQKN